MNDTFADVAVMEKRPRRGSGAAAIEPGALMLYEAVRCWVVGHERSHRKVRDDGLFLTSKCAWCGRPMYKHGAKWKAGRPPDGRTQ